jgi:hypothetical protein
MLLSKPQTEPTKISPGFFSAVEAKAARLEADALLDEQIAANLADADHARRHYMLVEAQREDARRFREFLTTGNVMESKIDSMGKD